MINRAIAPEFKLIEKVDVEQAQKIILNNGIEVYTLNSGSQELSRVEFIFKAGMYQQPKALVASCTNALIECGTKKFTANQISDGIDFFGSFLELNVGQDFTSITLYSLNKYLKDSLVFIEEIIKNPIFPQDEFSILINNKKQKHQINSQKVNVLARRKFNELLFGSTHPYGINVNDEDFGSLTVQDLVAFFNEFYASANCTIVASGLLPNNISDILNLFFGNEKWGNKNKINFKQIVQPQQTSNTINFVEKPDAIQNAIKIGRILFNKTHPDYFKFQVLSTVLGGYFGSRLMANIREDKGYTYGIGCGISNFVTTGYFAISTEVGSDVCKNALKEIYKEIEILQTDLIDKQELETVRNYILGQFLRSVDGPFSLADKFKGIWEFGLSYDYYQNYFKAVQEITVSEIRDLANNYLKKSDLIECVVGK